MIVDEYGLEPADREQIVPLVKNSAERAWFSMRDRAERLGGGWQRMWDEGVGDRILRRQQWLAEQADALYGAVNGR